MGKAVIGVTGPDRGGLIAWLMTALAIRRGGGQPLRITPGRPCDDTRLDAVVIGGGTDVDPFHYGEDRPPPRDSNAPQRSSPVDWLVGLVLTVFRALFASHSVQDYDPDRDRLEKHLIEFALYHKLPVLGICRGAQLMNVALGGSLHQKIEHFYSEDTGHIRSILPRKIVGVTAHSQLHSILRRDTCHVNALHDQSIKQLGDDISVCAVEHNGVVQAIEKQDHAFFIGVQWHPEYIPQSTTQQRLFQRLVRAAMER